MDAKTGRAKEGKSDSDNSSYIQGSRSTIATLDVCESDSNVYIYISL